MWSLPSGLMIAAMETTQTACSATHSSRYCRAGRAHVRGMPVAQRMRVPGMYAARCVATCKHDQRLWWLCADAAQWSSGADALPAACHALSDRGTLHASPMQHSMQHTHMPLQPASITLGPPQVILKPDPGNSQELYLGSLEALGIDTTAHDVRCVPK